MIHFISFEFLHFTTIQENSNDIDKISIDKVCALRRYYVNIYKVHLSYFYKQRNDDVDIVYLVLVSGSSLCFCWACWDSEITAFSGDLNDMSFSISILILQLL